MPFSPQVAVLLRKAEAGGRLAMEPPSDRTVGCRLAQRLVVLAKMTILFPEVMATRGALKKALAAAEEAGPDGARIAEALKKDGLTNRDWALCRADQGRGECQPEYKA